MRVYIRLGRIINVFFVLFYYIYNISILKYLLVFFVELNLVSFLGLFF